MHVYRKKTSRYWQFEFSIGGHTFSGSTKCEDKRAAEAHAKAEREKAERLISDMRATRRRPLTVGRAFDRWWDEHGKSLSEDGLKRDLDRLRARLGENTLLHDITDDMVAQMVQLRRADVRAAGRDAEGKQLYRPITARTVNKSVIDLLRRILRRARDNWNAVISCEPVWKRHRLRENKHEIRELTRQEEQLLDATERPEYAQLRRFAIITGLRRSELLLTWPQVDFDAAVIRVVAKGKTPRILPLSREAFAILWAQRGLHPTHVFTFAAVKTRRNQAGEIVLARGQRYPITAEGWKSQKRNTWKSAGIDARIHDLRHTAAMRMLRKTGNLKHAQKLLGHSTIAITAKHYTDATLEDLRSAMDMTALEHEPAPLQIEHKPKAQEQNE